MTQPRSVSGPPKDRADRRSHAAKCPRRVGSGRPPVLSLRGGPASRPHVRLSHSPPGHTPRRDTGSRYSSFPPLHRAGLPRHYCKYPSANKVPHFAGLIVSMRNCHFGDGNKRRLQVERKAECALCLESESSPTKGFYWPAGLKRRALGLRLGVPRTCQIYRFRPAVESARVKIASRLLNLRRIVRKFRRREQTFQSTVKLNLKKKYN